MAKLCVHLVPLFNALPTNDQMQIEELVRHQNYQKSELVMDPTSSNNLVIVAHGGARLYTLDENGRENVTQILKTGDYAGENWLFGEVNTNTYVEATENSEICLLNRNDFLALMKKNPELSIQLLEQNIIKVRAMHRQIQLLSLPKVEDRLLSYLQTYAKQVNKNSFTLPLKMKDLALYLGTTPETLSRKFVLLEKQGTLKRKLRHIDLF
ncbi:Crp/Fnr family transcriptional regulator [Lactobacillus helveticus]|uniref:Crp/Fnr family transcriptional regulator n=1 Tax=Lactobacillus helveticus TaxID=1587 RepID=UPI0015678757|nr:Crp/Fnr family transcriptional regulator [Lactobacillus helveticus]NRO18656.1 Transcriptional activatory protein AadR [Lactobacillus helveticus]NRO78315.1 Transcriptional activatory protein AadR [Lactobacillus helveticus]